LPDVDVTAVLVATVASFALGGAYYAFVGEQLAAVSATAAAEKTPPPWTLGVEALRN
jgi:hypothetical protein